MNVYLIGPRDGPYKVGVADDIGSRLEGLQTGCFVELFIHAVRPCLSRTEALRLERQAHAALQGHSIRGEWFSCSLEQAVESLGGAEHATVPRQGTADQRKDARDRVYAQFLCMARQIPPESRPELADFLSAASSSPEDIAEARTSQLIAA